MKAILIRLVAFLCLAIPAHAATTILPPAVTCFSTANGPVVSGSLNMYIPGTTTPKQTWQDSAQTIPNSQPISLDANGCAIIYGTGSYRQQLYDGPVVGGSTSGNLVFDQITTDTSAYNSVFWSGTSSGTPNVISIVDTGFNATDGTVINFTALNSNTGPTTINPSGFGPINVKKDTSTGPVSLTGGEIIANNPISVIYRSADNSFHLLNTVISTATGNNSPLCGASNLKIVNDTTTPNSIADITARGAIMSNALGLVVNRANISVSVNTTLGNTSPTAGGMDGESPGTNAWLYIFLIDNGSSPAGLASTSSGLYGLNPNLPSGYTYFCRIGAMRIDSSGLLKRSLQLDSRAQYVVTTASNTTEMPAMATGTAGTVTSTPTWVPVDVSSFIPPTASAIDVVAWAAASGIIIAAPNNNYGGSVSGTTSPPPLGINNASGSTPFISAKTMLLESSPPFIYWASSIASGGELLCAGWIDNL